MIKVYFDGACGPRNPNGVASWGFQIQHDQRRIIGLGVIGEGEGMTNNVAEYTALIEAFVWLREHVPNLEQEIIDVYGDSNLVIQMITKRWGHDKKGNYAPHIDKPHLKVLLDTAQNLVQGLITEFAWIPREQNELCDELSKRAFKFYRKGRMQAGQKIVGDGQVSDLVPTVLMLQTKNVPLELNNFLTKTLRVSDFISSEGSVGGNASFKYDFKYGGRSFKLHLLSDDVVE